MTRPLGKTMIEKAEAFIRSGMSVKATALRLGVSQNTICNKAKPHEPQNMRPCSKCGLPMVRGGWCRPCKNKYTKMWRKSHPEFVKRRNRLYYYSPSSEKKRRAYQLKRSFSITMDEYNALLNSQGGRCAICGSLGEEARYRRLCVDHNHVTNRLRGLLCRNCNSAIGLMGDDPDILRKAIEYLERVGRH